MDGDSFTKFVFGCLSVGLSRIEFIKNYLTTIIILISLAATELIAKHFTNGFNINYIEFVSEISPESIETLRAHYKNLVLSLSEKN